MIEQEKELTLKQVQSHELEILVFFDAFCKENNIEYSLYAGTMLGAIRHNGFIPWDDDVDVILTRDNYNKFTSAFSSTKRYSLVNYSTNKDCKRILFSKIFDTTTKATESNIKPLPNEGVWLDIFPLDFVPNSSLKRKSLNFRFCLISKLLLARSTKRPNAFYCFLKVLFFWKTNKSLLESLNKYSGKAKKSNFVNDLTMINFKKLSEDFKFKSSLFQNYIEVEFEGRFFSCFSEYDKILKIQYGNYLVLPPVSQRHTHSMNAYLK